jgi:hypothetical protein
MKDFGSDQGAVRVALVQLVKTLQVQIFAAKRLDHAHAADVFSQRGGNAGSLFAHAAIGAHGMFLE